METKLTYLTHELANKRGGLIHLNPVKVRFGARAACGKMVTRCRIEAQMPRGDQLRMCIGCIEKVYGLHIITDPNQARAGSVMRVKQGKWKQGTEWWIFDGEAWRNLNSHTTRMVPE